MPNIEVFDTGWLDGTGPRDVPAWLLGSGTGGFVDPPIPRDATFENLQNQLGMMTVAHFRTTSATQARRYDGRPSATSVGTILGEWVRDGSTDPLVRGLHTNDSTHIRFFQGMGDNGSEGGLDGVANRPWNTWVTGATSTYAIYVIDLTIKEWFAIRVTSRQSAGGGFINWAGTLLDRTHNASFPTAQHMTEYMALMRTQQREFLVGVSHEDNYNPQL